MVPGDMYEWSRVIFAKKSKFHDAGGPDTVVSPNILTNAITALDNCQSKSVGIRFIPIFLMF